MSNLFVIEGVEIQQDANGRFCLNDLHRASGGADKDKPGNWLQLQQTQNLISEILSDAGFPASEENQPLSVVKGGAGIQGTFVCKDLVYAYTMWINAAFHLKVIRTFDAVSQSAMRQKPQDALDVLSGVIDALKVQRDEIKAVKEQQQIVNQATKGMFDQLKKVKQQTQELEQSVEAKIDHKINHSLDYDKNLNATEVGIYLRGVSAQEVNRCAAYLGWINPILKDENDARRGIIGWILQPEGQPYAQQRLDEDGQPLTPITYNKTAAELIRQLRNSKPSSAWSQQQIIKRYREG